MNEAQRQVMDTAHRGWEEKRRLADELRKAAEAYAMNVYREYRGVRGCSTEASYREACDSLKLALHGAEDVARNAVQMEVIKERPR